MTQQEENMQTAVLVGVTTGAREYLEESTPASMEELEALAATAGAQTIAVVVQNRQAIDPATFVGQGKLEEIKELCDAEKPDLLIFDDELSGSQVRNIEQAVGVRVVDRSRLILDIFAQRATSREGKCQVELAQLQYMLPRLSGIGADLSRLGAGIGTRGPGETKLETDRRHIRTRISHLRSELREIEQHRGVTRQRRVREQIPVIALVGYTNAGKSTLLNALTGAGTLAEDKLFATLDPLVRRCTIEDELEVLFIDTVGFIRKLPHHLVEAFRSTLEESVYADLILHVVDVSNPEYLSQMEVVERLLREIGAAEKPVVTVYNKTDLATGDLPGGPDSIRISARDGHGIPELLSKLRTALEPKKREAEAFIPYADGAAVSFAHEMCKILSEEHEAEGTRIRLVADAGALDRLQEYLQ